MVNNPAPKRDQPLLDELAPLGIGPGLSPEDAGLSPAALEALYDGVSAEAVALPTAARVGFLQESITNKGWVFADSDIGDSRVTPGHLVGLLELVEGGTLSTTLAKQVFEEMFHTGKNAREVVAERGLAQISDAPELAPVIARVVAENGQAVSDYRSGKEGALGFLVGQVMKATRGQANPKMVNSLLRKELE